MTDLERAILSAQAAFGLTREQAVELLWALAKLAERMGNG